MVRAAIYTQTVHPIMMQHQVIIIYYVGTTTLSIRLTEQIYEILGATFPRCFGNLALI